MKTVIVTGATSGIGYEVCKKLLAAGYRMIGIGRNKGRCEEAAEKLKKATGGDITFFCADLFNISGQENVCQAVILHLQKYCGGKFYALINNVGCVKSRYGITKDGIERQFALNHLAGFNITYMLKKHIENDGRIIFTGSMSHKKAKINWKNIMHKGFYNPLSVYAQSKLCNVLFAYGINSRYGDDGIRAYVVDPGLVNTNIGNKETGFLVNLIWSIRKKSGTNAAVPAETYLYLCENTPQGLYYYNSKEAPYSKLVNNENFQRLFDICEELLNIKYDN